MDLIILQIKPSKRLEFINYYIEIGKLIKINDRKAIRKLQNTFAILILQSCQFLYQYLFPLSPLNQIIQGDYARMLNVRRELYFFIIGTLFLSMYYLHFLYMGNFYHINSLLEAILFKERTDFFIYPYYKNQKVNAHVRKFTYYLVHGFQQFIWVIGKSPRMIIFGQY